MCPKPLLAWLLKAETAGVLVLSCSILWLLHVEPMLLHPLS